MSAIYGAHHSPLLPGIPIFWLSQESHEAEGMLFCEVAPPLQAVTAASLRNTTRRKRTVVRRLLLLFIFTSGGQHRYHLGNLSLDIRFRTCCVLASSFFVVSLPTSTDFVLSKNLSWYCWGGISCREFSFHICTLRFRLLIDSSTYFSILTILANICSPCFLMAMNQPQDCRNNFFVSSDPCQTCLCAKGCDLYAACRWLRWRISCSRRRMVVDEIRIHSFVFW